MLQCHSRFFLCARKVPITHSDICGLVTATLAVWYDGFEISAYTHPCTPLAVQNGILVF
jgi:hypothetical protein